MGFFDKFFGSKNKPTQPLTYDQFWLWFQANSQRFYSVVSTQGEVEKEFFDKLTPKLDAIRPGYYVVAGMYNDTTAELIITSEGVIKNMVFVEELIAAAPAIPGWKFTAHKPATGIEEFTIKMGDYVFSQDLIRFYPVEHDEYPDEIDIAIVYPHYNEADRQVIVNGLFIFLDNYLGEVDAITRIDNIQIMGPADAKGELIAISKLKAYIDWREKEFLEKYEGTRHNTDTDDHAAINGQTHDGHPVIAIVDTALLKWDGKASHPWILKLILQYTKRVNGMPDAATMENFEAFDNDLLEQLRDSAGYLYVARQTSNGERLVYYACKDFRLPAKVADAMVTRYTGRIKGVAYDICKDKYWQSLEHYNHVQ